MPPIVSIVGKSEAGKTTLIQKLIQELKSRGYRVATIKHVPQDLVFDERGKDSWRHVEAGSEITAISSPDKLVLIKPVAQAPKYGQNHWLQYHRILSELSFPIAPVQRTS